jgi:hypothetical protein
MEHNGDVSAENPSTLKTVTAGSSETMVNFVSEFTATTSHDKRQKSWKKYCSWVSSQFTSSLLYKRHSVSPGRCWRISLKAMADTVTSGARCVRMCRGAPSGTELASTPGACTTNNYVMINHTSRLLIKPVRYGVLKVVTRRSTVFCDVTPCSLVEMYWKQTTAHNTNIFRQHTRTVIW